MTRKSVEPACRVCGCTEHNACDEGCAWVRVEVGSLPLCSACSGTAADMVEAIKRGCDWLRQSGELAISTAIRIGTAARSRRKAREKAEANVVDGSWGSR